MTGELFQDDFQILESPKKAVEMAKKEAAAKQEINMTQIELAQVVEMRRRQEEELQQAMIKLDEIKRGVKCNRVDKEDSDYEYEYDSETIEREEFTQQKPTSVFNEAPLPLLSASQVQAENVRNSRV